MITVLSQTPLATVQDLGRAGALRWGVGTAGAMDPMALAAGNMLVGNDAGAAGIEIQVFPFEARLERDGVIAVTGASCAVALDGEPALPWFSIEARAGQVVLVGPPQAGPMPARKGLPLRLRRHRLSRRPELPQHADEGRDRRLRGRSLRSGDRLPLGEAAPGIAPAGPRAVAHGSAARGRRPAGCTRDPRRRA